MNLILPPDDCATGLAVFSVTTAANTTQAARNMVIVFMMIDRYAFSMETLFF